MEEADKQSLRMALEAEHGKTWDTDELVAEFAVHGFLAPYVVVVRKVDGVKGSMQFTHYPRFYFGWTED